MHVDNVVAVVTGGASGIGEGVVRMLAGLGGRVPVLDLPSSDGELLAKELGEAVAFFSVDVTAPDEVTAAVAAVREHFGRIDVLVNSAGISPAARVVSR